MAAPMPKETDKSESDEVPEELNPMSPKFNPMLALYDKDAHIPMPDAKQFNNIAEFENFLQGKDAKSFKEKRKSKKAEMPGIIAVRAAAQAKENVRKAAILAKCAPGPSTPSNTQQRRKRNTNVFTWMEGHTVGPLSLLRKCAEERIRVVVVVRAAVAVRSRCRGYVIAYDKHFNMALMDVDEKFIRPIHKKGEKKKEGKPVVKVVPSDNKLSEKMSESLQRAVTDTDVSRRSSSKEGVIDLRNKLKHSRLTDRQQKVEVKSSDSEFSESELSRSKGTGSRSNDTERSQSLLTDSGKKESKGSVSHRQPQCLKDIEKNKTVDEKGCVKTELKRSADFKEHFQNYLSDSNVYVKRQQKKLEEKGSKSDSENTTSSRERLKKQGSDLQKKFQPFWPLYKKWTENRCYAEYEMITRHVNQLFIRGDNVVSVSIAEC